MHVTLAVWLVTIVILVGFLLVDVFVIGRRPHEPSMKEVSITLGFYVLAALAFGVGVYIISGPQYGIEFLSGWLTEYSLSIDNLFIFIIIMSNLRVPRELQQFALMVGIILALIFRGIFIALGSALISAFAWVFFLFGAFLIYTAVKLYLDYRNDNDDNEQTDNALVRWVNKHMPATDQYHGDHLTVKIDGKRLITPMFIVIVALGSTDLLFALDSIPAIFGLTKEPYLVFCANVFALMGLRQLYFLIGGLLKKLVYLSVGLSVILAFIGVKLLMEATESTGLGHLMGIPDVYLKVPTWLSLTVIVVVLLVTTVASLIKSSRAKD
ncbi:MAG: TerC family protein [Propionibacteriaceae bacterium]|jgi:tellurite resistance protein TerC|nr:TerC family protein [Propionibacteriaceae bacterium]